MNSRRLLHVVMILSLAALALANQPAQAQTFPQSQMNVSPPQPATDLASLLQPDGTLDVPAGMEGSFNVEGWQMALDEDGTPHFYPPEAQPAASSNTEDLFWSPNLLLGAEEMPNEDSTTIFAMAALNDLVYVAGNFSQVGAVQAKNIARWNILQSRWEALGSGVDSTVHCLEVYANYVYAGGIFNIAGGIKTGPLARWDDTTATWSPVATFSVDSYDPIVYAVRVGFEGEIYVGGYFDHVDGVKVNNIAGKIGSSWNSMGGGVTGADPIYTSVRALYVINFKVYAGGSFDHAGGDPANNLAVWDNNSWRHVGNGVGGGDHPIVNAIAYIGANDIIVGGSFSEAYQAAGGMLAVSNIARCQNDVWSNMGGGVNGHVMALHNFAAMTYVGGYFTTAGGSLSTRYVAGWNGTWHQVKAANEFSNGTDDAVFSLASTFASGQNLFLGGWFEEAGERAAHHLAAYSLSAEAWNALGNSPNATVNALTIAGGYAYVGGTFSSAGGVTMGGAPLGYVGRMSLNDGYWYVVGNGNAIAGCRGLFCQPSVNTILVSGEDVYIGGNFLTIGGATMNGVAMFEYSDDYLWHAFGSGVACTGGCGTPVVRDMVFYNNALYIGGTFDTAGGKTVNNVAAWNGSAWNALQDLSDTPGTNGTVYALSAMLNGVAVGGSFTVPGAYIVKWNGANWSNLGTPLNGAVYVIQGNGTRLSPMYIGGAFLAQSHIAQLEDFATWKGLGIGLDGDVHALAPDGKGGIYAGGDFDYSGLYTLTHIGHWNGSIWSSIGSGMNGAVLALARTGNRVVAGGDFTAAGGKPSYFIASWNKLNVFLPAVRK